jgi:hypothetical protein
MRRLLFLVCMSLILPLSLPGQQAGGNGHIQEKTPTTIPDSVLRNLEGLEPIFENIFIYDFFTTVNALHYENERTKEQKDELNFYYNVTLNNHFQTKYFGIRSYLFNEYGVKHFFDSVTIKGQDNFQIRNVIDFQIIKRRLRLQVGLTIKTQLWKTYNYQSDSNQSQRYLYTDYLSPGYFNYAMGISWKFMKNATLDLGLVGGKTTKIRNQQIFDDRRQKQLYGLTKGESKKVSYGLSLVVNVPPRKLTKHIGWEFTGSLYTDKEQMGFADLYNYNVMNVMHYMFLKNLRVSLRTEVIYDHRISPKVFLSNMISIGFYLSNKI